MTRGLLFGFLVVLGAGCATAEMDGADAEAVAADALEEAGVRPASVDAATEPSGDVWPVTVAVDDEVLELDIDRTSGAVTALDVPEAVELSERQLQTLAEHRGNPADRAARRTRAVVGVVVVLLVLGGAFLAAHRARLREWG